MDRASLNESEFLAHYGVKGMKWGVRRTPEQLGHYRMSERSARDRVLSPKTDLYRLSNSPDEFSKENKRDRAYVTTNQDDRDFYRSTHEYFWDPAAAPSISDMVEYTMNSVKPLTIAGGKTVVESLMRASKDPNLKDFSERNFASEGAMRKYLEKRAPNPDDGYGYDKYSTHDFANAKHQKINDAVFKDLRKKGYDGLVDLFDRSWETNDPTIIFDPQTNLKVKKVQRLHEIY